MFRPARGAHGLALGLALLVALLAACGGGGSRRADGGAPDAHAHDGAAHDGAQDAPPDGALPPPPVDVSYPSGRFVDLDPRPNVLEVELTADTLGYELDDGEVLPLMAYNGAVPGPLLEANAGDEVVVHFTNLLDEPTTVHWHGLRVPAAMDGSPMVQAPVEPGESFTYHFIAPDAGTYWYHPHVRTHEQVERGLAGPIIIRHPDETTALKERVFVLDDLLLDEADGTLPPFLEEAEEQLSGRIGNVFLSNGRRIAESTSTVAEGTVERWRLVNAANARTMSVGVTGASFRVIGTDGGPLAAPYVTERIELPPGQRYDLEVSFDAPGTVTLDSYVLVSEPGMPPYEAALHAHTATVEPTGNVPESVVWPSVAMPAWGAPSGEATLQFDFPQLGGSGDFVWTINGIAHPTEPLYTFEHSDVVKLILNNSSNVDHPFHLHGQFFQILDEGLPSTSLPGLKDTVMVPRGQTVAVLTKLENPGRWMLHCHILEHAELGMMLEIEVTDPDGLGSPGDLPDGGGALPDGGAGHNH